MNMADIEALKTHGYMFDSDSDSGKSEFDDEYYRNKPPPLSISPSRIFIVRAVNTQPIVQQPDTSWNNCTTFDYNTSYNCEPRQSIPSDMCNNVEMHNSYPRLVSQKRSKLKKKRRHRDRYIAPRFRVPQSPANSQNHFVDNLQTEPIYDYGNIRNKSCNNAPDSNTTVCHSISNAENVEESKILKHENISAEEVNLRESCNLLEPLIDSKTCPNVKPSVQPLEFKNVVNKDSSESDIPGEPFVITRQILRNTSLPNLKVEITDDDRKSRGNEETFWGALFGCFCCNF